MYWIHLAHNRGPVGGFVDTAMNFLFLHDAGNVLISRGCVSFWRSTVGQLGSCLLRCRLVWPCSVPTQIWRANINWRQ